MKAFTIFLIWVIALFTILTFYLAYEQKLQLDLIAVQNGIIESQQQVISDITGIVLPKGNYFAPSLTPTY